MKNKIFYLLLLAGVLAGCNQNVPDQKKWQESATWRVVKERVTNGDGIDGVVTHTGNFFWDIDTYVFALDSQMYMLNSAASYLAMPALHTYSLQTLSGNKLQLTVTDVFDKNRNLVGGQSPITIHSLTQNTMEWEFESYGGDEGPVVYYQYLTKVTDR